MGIIATITPGTMKHQVNPCRNVTKEDIANAGRIPIRQCTNSECIPSTLKYQALTNLNVKDSSASLDMLLKLTQPLLKTPRPSWNGFMQMVCKGDYAGKSSVMFLPMIDMDPGDMTCIYSTLSFIADHAYRYGITPIVTFDQPLWWKALVIVLNEPQGSRVGSIVPRLGGFHMEMSFVDCIGHLMAGSGLENVLEIVYAKNAVLHMHSGKAVARAIRGHFLVDAVLNTLLVGGALDLPGINSQRCKQAEEYEEDITTAGEKALVSLYGGNPEDKLDSLRYTMFCRKVATGTLSVQPETLPHTSAAGLYHSLRVFYQVQQWMGNSQLSPLDWGWQVSSGKLLSIRTHLPPAHESLLQMVKCKCKGDCSARRCSCRRNGLDCNPECSECKGLSCINTNPIEPDTDDDYTRYDAIE